MTDNPLRILMLVAWEVEKTDHDDLSKLSADIFVKKEGYWFLKYWPRIQDDIDVEGLSRSKLLRLLESRCLKFYLFHALYYLPRVRRHDIVMCFHSQIGVPLAFLMALFRIRKPLILFDVEGIGRKTHWSYRRLLNRILRHVTLLYYFSSDQLSAYETNYPEILPRAKFLPLGIDPRRFKAQPEGQPPEDFIAAVGYQNKRFRDWKTLLQAYGMVNTRTPLVIVGKNRLTREDTEDMPVPDGVRFTGRVNLTQLNEIVSKSRFMILPLPERHHSYGAITLLGAQALGKAVITAKVSGVLDYIDDGQTGMFYDPGNCEDLTEKIGFFLRSPKLANRIGKEAASSLHEKHTEFGMGVNFS